MRHRAWLVGVLAAATAACGANPDGTSRSGSAEPTPVGLDSARVDEGGREIVVSFIGSACTSTYAGEVTETASDVVLRIRIQGTNDRTPTTCAAIGYFRTVRVRLHDPLGHRRVIDAATSTEVDALRVEMPTPAWLPDGWTADAESGRSGRWSVAYGTDDGIGRVTVTVGPAEPSPIPPNSTVTGEVAVQGRRARWVLPNSHGYEELVLADDHYSVVLAPVSVDRQTVERIAESLQPLPIAEGAAAPLLPG